MHSMPRKRNSSSSLETIAANLPLAKKQRTEPIEAIPFSPLHEEVAVDVVPSYSIDFNFGELAHEFVSSPVAGNDLPVHGFDSFFADTPLNILSVNETSELSSDEEKREVQAKVDEEPSTWVCQEVMRQEASPESVQNSSSVVSDPKSEADSNQKRQADRAARNRESSRRAREKAKNRFRMLENDNRALQEMERRLRTQNDHLIAQLNRAQVMQQSCPMCKYNAAMAQQSSCAPSAASLLRQ